jgi:hypothetical protein
MSPSWWRWRGQAPVTILPALITPLLLCKLPSDFLPILLGDWLLLHFLADEWLTRAGHPAVTATANALAFGGFIAVTFPLVARDAVNDGSAARVAPRLHASAAQTPQRDGARQHHQRPQAAAAEHPDHTLRQRVVVVAGLRLARGAFAEQMAARERRQAEAGAKSQKGEEEGDRRGHSRLSVGAVLHKGGVDFEHRESS